MQAKKLKNGIYHIEAEGAIINIQEGLFDCEGRKVTVVSIIPENHIPGTLIWHLLGHANNRIVQSKDLKVR